jgi:anti-anti-sigma factor
MTRSSRDSGWRLEIESRRADDISVLELKGGVHANTVEKLATALEAAVTDTPKAIVVDVGGLLFIGSAGLGALVAAFIRCRRRTIEFRLCSASPEVRRELDLTKLDGLFSVYGTQLAALADLADL